MRVADEGLVFVAQQLQTARESVAGGPSLAALLERRAWSVAFGFVSAADGLIDARYGGLADRYGAGDRLLEAVAGWLSTPDPGRRRVMVLEESVWTVDTKWAGAAQAFAGPTPFYVCDEDSTVDDVQDAFDRQMSWPGVGVLARLPRDEWIIGALEQAELELLADSSIAVLVGAWDEESVLFATDQAGLQADPEIARWAADV